MSAHQDSLIGFCEVDQDPLGLASQESLAPACSRRRLRPNPSILQRIGLWPPKAALYGWDNVKNNHWNSMGRTAEVGHDKLLNPLDSGSPLLGTISAPHAAEQPR